MQSSDNSPLPNGVVEFDLRGLGFTEVDQAILSQTFDVFWTESAGLNNGVIPLRLLYAQGDGDVTTDDYVSWTHAPHQNFAVYSTGVPIELGVAEWIAHAVDQGWEFVSFRTTIWDYQGTDDYWARSVGGERFSLFVVPEPSTALLFAAGVAGLALRRRLSA